MKQTMRNDKWEKIVILEEREFRIKFWYDRCIGVPLFYTSIEEKIPTKPTFFNKKGYYFQKIVSDYWINETEQNPIELALSEIKRCLQTEKDLNKLEKMIDNFCK